MIRSAILVCAAVIVAACYGCAPSQQVQLVRAPGVGPPPGTTQTCPAGIDWASTVQFLPPGFSKAPPFTLPSPSVPVGSAQNPTQIYVDLNNAFKLAPPWFQNELCSLDGLFVDQTECGANLSSCLSNSWGVRNRFVVPVKRYVAVSQGLWVSGRPTYSAYENQLLRTLLGWNNFVPQHGPANSATDLPFEFTLLAVLAHEMGHVRYYDIARDRPSTPDCFTGFFESWNANYAPPLWRRLLTPSERLDDPSQRVPVHHKDPPYTSDIDAAANTAAGGNLLRKIYLPSAPWASFFASLSPDEDFVETYKLAVLTQATPPLKSLSTNILGTSRYQEDIPAKYWAAVNGADNSKAILVLKTACAASFM